MMHLKGKIRKRRIRLAGLISPFFSLMGEIWATVCLRGTKTPNGAGGNSPAPLSTPSLSEPGGGFTEKHEPLEARRLLPSCPQENQVSAITKSSINR